MASRVLRTAGAAAVLAGALANTACFEEGMEYVDGIVTASMPNGAFVQEPYLCQQACQSQVNTLGCKGFMWRGAPAPANAVRGAIGPGGCWLVGSKATLVKVNTSEQLGRIVSGPSDCGNTTAAPPAIIGTLAPMPTVPPVPTLPPVPTQPAVPTPAPAGSAPENSTNATAAKGAAEGAAEGASADAGGSGVSLWLIIVAVVAVVGISAAVYFVACGDGKTKASKKGKKEKKEKRTRGIELERRDVEAPADQAPLLAAASAPAPAQPAPAPVALAAPAAPLVPMQAPVLQMAGFQGARQPLSYVQPQGMYTVGPIAYTTGQPAVASTYVVG